MGGREMEEEEEEEDYAVCMCIAHHMYLHAMYSSSLSYTHTHNLGTLPDDHPNFVMPARSTALKGADVVVLVGARLNWILHFGGPPRYLCMHLCMHLCICMIRYV